VEVTGHLKAIDSHEPPSKLVTIGGKLLFKE
jgi:hypothetical protein